MPVPPLKSGPVCFSIVLSLAMLWLSILFDLQGNLEFFFGRICEALFDVFLRFADAVANGRMKCKSRFYYRLLLSKLLQQARRNDLVVIRL